MQAAGSRAHSNAWTPNAPLWSFPTSVILHAMICCWAGDNRHYWNTCLEEKRSYGGSFYTSQGFKLLRLMHRICHSSVTVSRLHWLDWISITKTRPLTMQMLLEVLQIHPPVPPCAHPEVTECHSTLPLHKSHPWALPIPAPPRPDPGWTELCTVPCCPSASQHSVWRFCC